MATTTDTVKEAAIRSKYAPVGIEKDMLKRVYDRYTAMKDSPMRKAAEKEWERGRKQWEAMREESGDDEWQSNHKVPLTTSVVESAISEMVDQSPQPFIIPGGSEDVPRAMVMGHVFNDTWEQADSDLEVEDVLHDALVEGTGIAQEYFYSDIRKIKTGRKEGKKIGWNEEDRIAYNDCYLECVKNDDFFVDEIARGFKGPFAARDCIRRYIMDIDAFKAFFKGPTWDHLGNAKYVTPGGDTNYYEYYQPPNKIDQSKQVEVLWYWSERPDDWLCIVANDVVVVMGPNPYRHKLLPFARAIDVRRTHQFYGKGEAALLESIQNELDTLRRMVIDRNHLDIDKMFIGSNRLQFSEEDLIARPHGFIPVEDANAIKAVEYNDIPRSVELSMDHLEDDATIATGINPRAQALPTTGTATEAAILKESTLKRIRLKIRRFERGFLTRVARLRVSNILQYYPQPKLEEMVGEQGTETFKQEMEALKARGLLEERDGKVYKKKYRELRTEDVMLDTDERGQPIEKSEKGFHFFELEPQYFVPTKGYYTIKIKAGSTIPISKPLIQSKTTEMYDRLIELAINVPGTYDPKKLGDMLIKVNDMNPADLAAEQQQPMDNGQARLKMNVELATVENNLMMKGKQIPSTAYASEAHTLTHVTFMRSPSFQELSAEDEVVQLFTAHVVGELAAQQDRQSGVTGDPMAQGGQQPMAGDVPLQQQTATQQGGNRTLNDLQPDRIQGGGQAPAAI